MVSYSTNVRTDALVQLDQVQELQKVSRLCAHLVVDELRLEKPAHVDEEVKHATVTEPASKASVAFGWTSSGKPT